MHIVLLAHNIRSTHNIGSIFRTAEGFGVNKLYLSGYTPSPDSVHEPPHVRKKLAAQISKTALGAEKLVPFEPSADPLTLIREYKKQGFTIAALEQTVDSVFLADFTPVPQKLLLVLGEEVHGIEPALLAACDLVIEIPMHGKKESFNVSVATGIALYHVTLVR